MMDGDDRNRAPGEVGNDSSDGYYTREGFSGGGVYRADVAVVENQEQLNAAVRDGCSRGDRSGTPPRGKGELDADGSFEKTSIIPSPAQVRGPTTNNMNLLPVGIIDLECYTSVKRSTRNDCVFELTGDDITNPDLRSFYFQAGSVEDSELWTKALLNDRHSALKDEREAYRQVCDSFQLQLQSLSDMIDGAEAKAAKSEKQLYTARSVAEKARGQITNIIRDALEQKFWDSEEKFCKKTAKLAKELEQNRVKSLDQLDEMLSSINALGPSNNNGTVVVQILADYLSKVNGSHKNMAVEMNRMEQRLKKSANVDKATVTDLKEKIERLEAEREEEREEHEGRIENMKAQIQEYKRTIEETENHVQSQRMEFTMFQNQAKTKLTELSQHKKILKKEVIELRKKVDEIGSERDTALHMKDTTVMKNHSEKEKNAVLEKYIENIENQVKVQQNMMEMISLSGMSQNPSVRGSSSVVGRIIATDDSSLGSFSGNKRARPSPLSIRDSSPAVANKLPPKIRVASESPMPSRGQDGPPLSPKRSSKRPLRGALDHEFVGKENENSNEKKRSQRRAEKKIINGSSHKTDTLSESGEDEDKSNKSHISELTEDRTQRAMEGTLTEEVLKSYMELNKTSSSKHQAGLAVNGESPVTIATGKLIEENQQYPPRFIGTENENGRKETSQEHPSAAGSQSTRRSKKLSVAQRARLRAENPNTVSLQGTLQLKDNSTVKSNASQSSSHQTTATSNTKHPHVRSESPSVFSSIGRSLVNAIDNSVIGVKASPSRSRSISPIKKANVKPSQLKEETSLTLAERQLKQRHRQLQILREKGLLKKDED